MRAESDSMTILSLSEGGVGARSRGTLYEAYRNYFRKKEPRPGRNPDSQDRSCLVRTFSLVASCLGVADWREVPVEAVTVRVCGMAYDDGCSRKACSSTGAARAIDEDFRVCARAFSLFGLGGDENPFLEVRMLRNPRARPPRGRVVLPARRADGRVCRKEVARSRREPGSKVGLGLVGRPDHPVYLKDPGDLIEDWTVVAINSGVRITTSRAGKGDGKGAGNGTG